MDRAPSLGHYTTDFDMFSRLPPNTEVHLSATDGHFVQTGGARSIYPGSQYLANWLKGHSDDKLITDINTFASNVIASIQETANVATSIGVNDIQLKAYNEFVSAKRTFENAHKGCTEGGGMQGLLTTYPQGPVHAAWQSAIESIKQALADHNLVHGDPLNNQERLPYCPEEHYTDEDWEKLMLDSSNLRSESIGYLKYYGAYTMALKLTETNVAIGKWNHWDKICDFNGKGSLYLGALPIVRGAFGYETRNDLSELQNLGIGAILSVTEVFENNSEGTITSPITPAQWRQAGIKQLQLPTPDFETIPLEHILKGVEFIRWNIDSGRNVYVHCKAGRGRSALIEMCYLIKYHNYTADAAFSLIRQQRKQAGFDAKDAKMQTLRDFERLLQALR
jgi:protein-tyrosine phosphatase